MSRSHNSHGAELDGKGNIQPTSFDAHEKHVRGKHVATGPDSPDKDPATVAEFPKAVAHVDHPSGVGKAPVVVNSAEEEADYNAQQSAGEAELGEETSAEEEAEEEESAS